jgi:GWxTD domain-containing protein
MNGRTLPRIFLAAAIFFIFTSAVSSQPPTAESKPRNQKKESSKVYEDWISKDVPYIATEEEKKAYKLLKTDEERENFIARFWWIRDPNPDTEENEYRLEYYERVAYANENFTSGKAGWMTDRGRIYIAWGKPDSIESRPMGGSYDRPAWEGGGTTSTYPFEVWFYRGRDGLPNGAEFEFVDPSGSGEFRLTTDPDEKDALLFVPGAGLTTRELLGLDRKADRIAGINNRGYYREQDSPFRRQELVNLSYGAPPVRGRDTSAAFSDTPQIDNNPLEFDMRVDLFRQSDERVVATFTILADNKELSFMDEGGIRAARLNVFGRLTSVTDRNAGTFQDAVTAFEEGDAATERRSVYQSSKSLAPGRYKVQVIVTDLESGSRGKREIGFEVPDYSKGILSTSTLILASTLRDTGAKDVGARFVIGDKKVIPNLTGVFRRGQDLGVFLQVYNAGIDQTTLAPSVDVEYIIFRNGSEVLVQKEDWKELSESGSRVTLARSIPTAGLEPGDYEIVVRVTDGVGETRQSVEQRSNFSVIE